MAAPPFLDTNILLYAGSNAPQDQPKKQIAAALIVSLDFCLSSQVIQEYLSNALGKKRLQITETQIQTTLECFAHVTGSACHLCSDSQRLELAPAFPDLPLGCYHRRRRSGTRLHNPLLRRPEPRAGL